MSTLNYEAIKNLNALVVISPRSMLVDSDFTEYIAPVFTVSYGVYVADLSFGHITSVEQPGDALVLTKVDAIPDGTVADVYFYDAIENKLYVTDGDKIINPGDPLGDYSVDYEIHCSTKGVYWHRDPTDTATDTVYYRPCLVETPETTRVMSDVFYGFLPSSSGTLALSNDDHFLELQLYSASFRNAPVEVYRWVNSLTASNIKLQLTAQVKSASYSTQEVKFSLLDAIATYDEDCLTETFDTGVFPSLDPAYRVGTDFLRVVYGRVDGHVPVNVDFNDASPSTSDNRDWVAAWASPPTHTNMSQMAAQSFTVASSPASTTTQTYLTSVTSINVGDSIWFDRASGTDEYRRVTAVGANYIQHSALSSGAMASGDLCKRSRVGFIDIVQNGVHYYPMYNRDFTEASLGSGSIGLGWSFTTTMESNLGMSTLTPSDRVTCRFYGICSTLSPGSARGIDLLLSMMKKELRDQLTNVDTTTLLDYRSAGGTYAEIADEISLVVPSAAHAASMTFKEVITKLSATLLMRVFLDDDFLWTARRIGPVSGSVSAIDEADIVNGSFEYTFDYDDIYSSVLVKYNRQEVSSYAKAVTAESYDSVSVGNAAARILHQVDREFVLTSLHDNYSDARDYADRLQGIFGERRGTVSFSLSTNTAFLDSNLGDEYSIRRSRLPGFEYVAGTDQEANLVLSEITKGIRGVSFRLDDQKGIEDNTGDW